MYLTRAVHRAVQQTPDLPATIGAEHVRSWSGSADRIARLAAGLTALGTAPGDRVAHRGVNSDVYDEALLAIAWADAVMVPVNTRWSASEIAFSLRDAGCRTLVVDAAFAGLVARILEEAPDVDTVVAAAGGEEARGTHDLEVLISGHEPAAGARRGGDALPLSAAGKVLKRELRARYRGAR